MVGRHNRVSIVQTGLGRQPHPIAPASAV